MDAASLTFHAYPVVLRNGARGQCVRTSDGRFACPICGWLLDRAPYDPVSFEPSFAWCPSCDFQIGWDDIIPTDAPAGAQEAKWQELRDAWLSEDVTPEAAARQLRHLEVDTPEARD